MGLTLAAISCQKKDSVKNEATESREMKTYAAGE